MRTAWLLALVTACGGSTPPPAKVPPPPMRHPELVAAASAYAEGDQVAAEELLARGLERPESGATEADYVMYLAILEATERFIDCHRFAAGPAIAAFPDSSRILEMQALCMLSFGPRDEAIPIAERVVAQRPTAYRLQWAIAGYYFKRDPEKAERALHAYLDWMDEDARRDNPKALLMLGMTYLRLDKAPLAEKVFRDVKRRFRARTWTVNADNGLCAALTGLGRFEEAVEHCTSIIDAVVDRSGAAWFNLAIAYHRLGRTEEARATAVDLLWARPEKRDKVCKALAPTDVLADARPDACREGSP
jgi:tetratricopeptide (TPR) repeat protein